MRGPCCWDEELQRKLSVYRGENPPGGIQVFLKEFSGRTLGKNGVAAAVGQE